MCAEKRALKERLSAIMKNKKHTKFTILISAMIFLVVTLTACAVAAGAGTQDGNTAPPTYESPESELPYSPEAPEMSDYPIMINGVGFRDNFYTLEGEPSPTHVPLDVVTILGLDVIQGGSQIAIQRNGEELAFLNVINYLTFGNDRIAVGLNNTFMVDDDSRFTIYVPLSLFREIGFETYFTGCQVHIYGAGGNQQEPTQPEGTQPEPIQLEEAQPEETQASAADHWTTTLTDRGTFTFSPTPEITAGHVIVVQAGTVVTFAESGGSGARFGYAQNLMLTEPDFDLWEDVLFADFVGLIDDGNFNLSGKLRENIAQVSAGGSRSITLTEPGFYVVGLEGEFWLFVEVVG